MLKFEGVFKTGDIVKAFDHQPMSDRPDRFFVGEVINESFTTDEGACGYLVKCNEDFTFTKDGGRKGMEIFVPFQVSLFEYDNRITLH